MFTKTQEKVMEVFVSKIDEKFSIKQISEILKKPYPLVHRSIKVLLNLKYLIKDNKNLISINYKENQSQLSYVESIRKNKAIERNKTLSLLVHDVLETNKLDFFVFLVFGSYVEKENPRDIDLILIIEDKDKIREIEKLMDNICSKFTVKFEVQVISLESAYEMLSKRDKINILNETLNKHILLFGAENYYRILKNAR